MRWALISAGTAPAVPPQWRLHCHCDGNAIVRIVGKLTTPDEASDRLPVKYPKRELRPIVQCSPASSVRTCGGGFPTPYLDIVALRMHTAIRHASLHPSVLSCRNRLSQPVPCLTEAEHTGVPLTLSKVRYRQTLCLKGFRDQDRWQTFRESSNLFITQTRPRHC